MLGKKKYRVLQASCILFALAVEAKAAEDGDWTVVTMSRGGAFGLATDASIAVAIATAVRDCKSRSFDSDCGAEFRVVRRGWILAELCGDERVLAAGQSRDEAEVQLIFRIDLKRAYIPNLPSCKRIFAIDPNGWVHCKPDS